MISCLVTTFPSYVFFQRQKMVDPYWPDEINVPVRHGELTVTMTGVSVLETYAVRKIIVTMVNFMTYFYNRSKQHINIARGLQSNLSYLTYGLFFVLSCIHL